MRSFFWALAATLTACTLLTPLDDYEGRDDAAAPPSSTPVDGGTDIPEASIVDSGRPETSIPEDDGGLFTCATRKSGTTLVCTEFNAALETDWTEVDRRQDGGTIGLNQDESVAPPGMEARLDLNESLGVNAAIRLKKNLVKGTTPRHVRIAFSVKVVRRLLSTGNFISIAELLCGEGKPAVSPFDGVWLHFRPVNGAPVLHIMHGSKGDPHALPDFPFDAWTRLSLDVWLENGITKSDVFFDGTFAGGHQTTGVVCSGVDDRRAVVGLSSDVSSRAFYDNVIVDVE